MRLAILIFTSATVGCTTPTFETDLLPEGPPEVTLISVSSSSAGEGATYCGAPKRNLFFCPETGDVDPILDAPPLGLYFRVVFDELLDPSIEELDEETGTGSIENAQPVEINCAGAAVTYGGFYQPSGSHLTNPPGPALVIEPTGVIAGGSTCTVQIGDAPKDKSGNGVPVSSQGPFTFSLEPFALVGTNPQDMTEGLDADATLAVIFNNFVDEGSLAGRISVDEMGGGNVAVDVVIDPATPDVVLISPAAGTFNANTTYVVTVSEGILDLGGASFMPMDGAFVFTFTTGA